MSLTGVRQALADALSTVDGVSGFLKPPATGRPGDAWPRLDGLTRDPGGSGQFLATWRVILLLSTDEAVALDSLVDLVPDLDDALRPIGYVESYTPVLYRPASGAEMPALEITITRE